MIEPEHADCVATSDQDDRPARRRHVGRTPRSVCRDADLEGRGSDLAGTREDSNRRVPAGLIDRPEAHDRRRIRTLEKAGHHEVEDGRKDHRDEDDHDYYDHDDQGDVSLLGRRGRIKPRIVRRTGRRRPGGRKRARRSGWRARRRSAHHGRIVHPGEYRLRNTQCLGSLRPRGSKSTLNKVNGSRTNC